MDGGGERKIKHNVMLIEGSSGFLCWFYRGGEVTGCRNCTSHGKSVPGTRVFLNWVKTEQKKSGFGVSEDPSVTKFCLDRGTFPC